MPSKIVLPSAKTIISTAASAAATAMVVRSFARDFIPPELRHYLLSKFPLLLTAFTNDVTLFIDEFDGLNRNQLFSAAELYISTVAGPSTKRLRAFLPEKGKQIHVSLGENEEIPDLFRGAHLKWRLFISKNQTRRVTYPGEDDGYGTTVNTEVRYLGLTFHKKHKNTVIDEYLPYVVERSKAIKEEKKTLKLHTLKDEMQHFLPGMSPWESVNLDHPANFETLAMDGEMKSAIMDDLDRFVNRRELYRKVGKAWKRGYLLFGPPGTGKSSLVAAMANYLRFDVYDLELTSVRSNSLLRSLLLSTANRSIVVVEDIDASIDLTTRKGAQPAPMYSDHRPKVTLSGLLNYIDGLWSSCGDERIIIFTTNHKDELDPALLRPGRMDVHIHMSYCNPSGFKLLATNYLGPIGENNPLAIEAEQLIASTNVTPAEVGEYLLKSDDPETALKGLIEFLDLKKETEKENDAAIGLKSEKILEKGEAVNAERDLIGILESKTGAGKMSPSNSSSVATGKENGIKSVKMVGSV